MEQNREKLKFTGNGGELFIIYLVNILLTMITLGIYSFWARVKVTKFFYQNTELMDEPFSYQGTGAEKLNGFLKALLILFGFGLAIAALTMVLGLFLEEQTVAVLLPILIYLCILLVFPLVLIGSERYRLSRSAWRNIRFKFTGQVSEFYKICLSGGLFTILTLGIYYPWFYYDIAKYFIQNSGYGSEKFDFIGDRTELAKKYYLGLLYTILTLGIYAFWWAADLHRYNWNNTTIQGKRMQSALSGGALFKIILITLFHTVITLGLGLAWSSIWNMKLLLETTSIDSGIDLSLIEADNDSKASALADGIGDAADALDAVGSVFGG